ncbi:antithrombin-iii-like isoform 2 protein [Lasius niger]|uniref:Antithrombin-iii-like isoform 2 protein n=1 Tax=Lasius niger TaxID=67767 RepID=A0A0J7KE55_LASNI|nr:antithrombin-iii-like isoform 2 protein [Lasius niger]
MEQKRLIEIEKILTKARFKFAIKCLYRLMLLKPKNDIAFSPHSMYEGLLSVYFMSSGEIETYLKRTLYLSDVCKYDLIQYYSSRKDFEQLENNASVASTDSDDARGCWIKATKFNHPLPLKNIFNNGFEVFDPDYTPIEKMDRINMAIQNAVKNHMSNPMKLKVVRNDMELVLMTVSRLEQKFQISTTCQFDASNVSNLRDKRKGNSFFSHELNMHVSEFPYTNENRSLYVFLPGSIISGDFSMRRFPIFQDVCALIERLSTQDAICKLRNLLDSDTPSKNVTQFSIGPIFHLEKDVPMRGLLRDLGVKELLKPDAINLERLFVNNDSVHLGNAMHRINVKVTEEDTVAGAVTVIHTGQETPRNYTQNILNYNLPFVWLIYDKQRRDILFAGAFNKFDRRSPSPV